MRRLTGTDRTRADSDLTPIIPPPGVWHIRPCECGAATCIPVALAERSPRRVTPFYRCYDDRPRLPDEITAHMLMNGSRLMCSALSNHNVVGGEVSLPGPQLTCPLMVGFQLSAGPADRPHPPAYNRESDNEPFDKKSYDDWRVAALIRRSRRCQRGLGPMDK